MTANKQDIPGLRISEILAEFRLMMVNLQDAMFTSLSRAETAAELQTMLRDDVAGALKSWAALLRKRGLRDSADLLEANLQKMENQQ